MLTVFGRNEEAKLGPNSAKFGQRLRGASPRRAPKLCPLPPARPARCDAVEEVGEREQHEVQRRAKHYHDEGPDHEEHSAHHDAGEQYGERGVVVGPWDGSALEWLRPHEVSDVNATPRRVICWELRPTQRPP